MLGERIFKVIINVTCISSLYKILLGEDCDFLDVRIGGNTENPLYFYNHPCQKLPRHLDNFYLFKLSYHLYELGHTLVLDRHRLDFVEYLLHHFLTFVLILFSYSVGYLPVGAAVMVLHDVTDLAVSIFKLTIDITPGVIQAIGYVVMVVPWVYFRLWYFPFHLIARIPQEYMNWHGAKKNFQLVSMLSAFLCALCCLHVFWFYLMVKGLVKRMMSKNWKEQVSLQSSSNRDE